MDKHFTPPPPRQMFAPEPLSQRLRRWRPSALQLGLLVSLAFHALAASSLAIWALVFGLPDFARAFQNTDLEVILVNARSNEAPAKAQAVAQANLAGGGEAEAGIATSPLPPSATDLVGDDQTDATKAIQQMQQMQQQILAQIRHEVAAMPVPDPHKTSMTQAEREQEEKRQRKLRQLAEIEKRINTENSRPRRRYISPATREEVYAVYTDKLRSKIEQKGTANFPTVNGHKLYGELTVNITIDAKGHVIDTDIVHSSNSHLLDTRALAIARAAAPFGEFTDDMKRGADELVLTWRFRFTNDAGMQATITKSEKS